MNFSSLHTSKETVFDFTFAELPPLICIDNNNTINTEINLIPADFGTIANSYPKYRHHINLFGSEVSKIRFDYANFKLCFFQSDFPDPIMDTLIKSDSILVDNKRYYIGDKYALNNKEFKSYLQAIFPFDEITDSIINIYTKCFFKTFMPRRLSPDEIKSTVEIALKSFSDHGQKDSYELLDIDYKGYASNFEGVFFKYLNLYGYRKGRIIIWIGVLIFIFSIFTCRFYNKLNRHPQNNGIYRIAYLPESITVTSISRFFQRYWYSLCYSCIIFFTLSIKFEKLNFKHRGIIYILAMYISGIVCLAYLANFILQK
jgi:hypothetical protein